MSMNKKWVVTCQCDYCADVRISVIVEANTEREARIKAEQLLEKEGHKSIWIVNCMEQSFLKNEKKMILHIKQWNKFWNINEETDK